MAHVELMFAGDKKTINMSPKELNFNQFSILQRFHDINSPVFLYEVDTEVLPITNEVIDAINKTLLPASAVSFIEDKEDAQPQQIIMIEQLGDGRYSLTSSGRQYIEYFKSIIID